MSDPQALLAAIFAHPDEDTPRLAYADWLDEHGSAHDRNRAEFIRLQIEFARGVPDARRRKSSERRCAELERLHRAQWLAPFAAICADPRVVPEFRRGFVDRITGPVDAPEWARGIVPLCPVQELAFEGHAASPDTSAWTELAECPALAGVRRIDFISLPLLIAEALFSSPHLTGLKALCAGWAPAESLETIARSSVAGRLRELRVSGAHSTAPPGTALRALLSTEWVSLEELRIERLAAGCDWILPLVTECAARGRKRLHVLADLPYADRSVLALARSAIEAALPGAPGGLGVGRSGYRERMPAEPPFAARELHLTGFPEEGDALAAWVRGTVPPGRFDRLAITHCRMNASGAVCLSAWPGLAHLTELDLSHNWFGDLGAVHLAESPYLENVEALFVATNDITKRGKDALKKRFGRRVRIS